MRESVGTSVQVVGARVMHGYPIRRLPVPVPETADHGAGTGREMRARVRVRIVNFHVLTRPRVFAHRLPYSAQYVDGVVSTLKGTHNLYQQKALARWIQLTLILIPKKIRGSTAGRDQIRRVRAPVQARTLPRFGRVRKSLPVHDSGPDPLPTTNAAHGRISDYFTLRAIS